MTRELALLSQARRAIGEARNLDELKHIRDKAEAIRQYAKARGESLAIQNEAAEIKLRAERRAGELLDDAGPRPGGDRKSSSRDERMKLADLGISANDSHRWQREAAIPEHEFERHVVAIKAANKELTTAGILRLARDRENAQRMKGPRSVSAQRAVNLDGLIAQGKRFGTIYADPPWQYSNQATRASTNNHYVTMTPEEIAALPIGALAEEKSHLHLWTTNAFLFECPRILEAWDFEYKGVFVWVKPQMGIGNYWRVSHEFLILGVRGSLTFGARDQMSWREMRRGEHSSKPEEVRQIIEKVSPGPRLELFGRRSTQGWTVWGNEVESQIFAPIEATA